MTELTLNFKDYSSHTQTGEGVVNFNKLMLAPTRFNNKMEKPSEKDKRYDRQLRLWGDHGQKELESANVCLINATATGTEVLKNLVLPGIGSFTIVDEQVVTSRDLGSNFFVAVDKLNTSRAACAAEYLSELNDTVSTNVCTEPLRNILDTSHEFFNQFTIVIATGLASEELRDLARLLWERKIPLVIARSYGLIGYLRLVCESHEVIESHPDSYHEDLRIDYPFNSLCDYIDDINIDQLDNTKHANLPYLVVLFKYLEKWKANHDGSAPTNYRQKKEFKEFIRSGVRTNEEGVPLDEENFDEAIKSVNSVLVPSSIPANVQAILTDPCCLSVSTESNNFWLLAQALRDFVAGEANNLLPLRGSIPDMISSSNLYIDLQRLYQMKAKSDIDTLTSYLNQILLSVGKTSDAISEWEIKQFCRNSSFLNVVRTRSLSEEYSTPIEELSQYLSDCESNIVYYILLRAADLFYAQFKSYPGSSEHSVDSDVTHLKSFVSSLIQENDSLIADDKIIEFCRYGGGELHSVAAYVGGVASQEVIKLITHQYVPINNTYLYNATSSTSVTAAL